MRRTAAVVVALLLSGAARPASGDGGGGDVEVLLEVGADVFADYPTVPSAAAWYARDLAQALHVSPGRVAALRTAVDTVRVTLRAGDCGASPPPCGHSQICADNDGVADGRYLCICGGGASGAAFGAPAVCTAAPGDCAEAARTCGSSEYLSCADPDGVANGVYDCVCPDLLAAAHARANANTTVAPSDTSDGCAGVVNDALPSTALAHALVDAAACCPHTCDAAAANATATPSPFCTATGGARPHTEMPCEAFTHPAACAVAAARCAWADGRCDAAVVGNGGGGNGNDNTGLIAGLTASLVVVAVAVVVGTVVLRATRAEGDVRAACDALQQRPRKGSSAVTAASTHSHLSSTARTLGDAEEPLLAAAAAQAVNDPRHSEPGDTAASSTADGDEADCTTHVASEVTGTATTAVYTAAAAPPLVRTYEPAMEATLPVSAAAAAARSHSAAVGDDPDDTPYHAAELAPMVAAAAAARTHLMSPLPGAPSRDTSHARTLRRYSVDPDSTVASTNVSPARGGGDSDGGWGVPELRIPIATLDVSAVAEGQG